MDTAQVAIHDLEAVEAWEGAFSRTAQTRSGARSSRTNGGQSSLLLAAGTQPRSASCAPYCLLRHARCSTLVRRIAQPTEPPYADPHVRWCGRGERVTAPPIPIPQVCGACSVATPKGEHSSIQ